MPVVFLLLYVVMLVSALTPRILVNRLQYTCATLPACLPDCLTLSRSRSFGAVHVWPAMHTTSRRTTTHCVRQVASSVVTALSPGNGRR